MRIVPRVLLAVAVAVAVPLATAGPASAGLVDECLRAAQTPVGGVVIEIAKCLPDPA